MLKNKRIFMLIMISASVIISTGSVLIKSINLDSFINVIMLSTALAIIAMVYIMCVVRLLYKMMRNRLYNLFIKGVLSIAPVFIIILGVLIVLLPVVYSEFLIGQWLFLGIYMGILLGMRWSSKKINEKNMQNAKKIDKGNNVYYIKRQKRKSKKDGFKYTVSGMPNMLAYTNFYRGIKKAEWIVSNDNRCKLEQTNKLLRWTDIIPLVNAIVNLIQHRKYNIIYNHEPIGHVDRIWAGIDTKFRFVIRGKKYFSGGGNTKLLHPWKSYYEWPVEADDGSILAVIRTYTYNGTGEYIIEVIKEEFDITIFILMVMLSDINWFSDEVREQVI